MLFGMKNNYTARTREVRAMLNTLIGCDMVQHGEQTAYKFAADDAIYVFAPNGGTWVIRQGRAEAEMPGMMKDLFRYVFGIELV
jgi:hypothetical protein